MATVNKIPIWASDYGTENGRFADFCVLLVPYCVDQELTRLEASVGANFLIPNVAPLPVFSSPARPPVTVSNQLGGFLILSLSGLQTGFRVPVEYVTFLLFEAKTKLFRYSKCRLIASGHVRLTYKFH